MKVKELSVDQLIELAQSDKDTTELSDEVERFIYELGIHEKQGERVAANIIYYNYILWKEKLQETNILTRQAFFRKFIKKFKRQIGSGERYYNVNKEVFIDNLDARIEMRKLHREEKKWYRKRNAQLKKGKKNSIQD